jgi:hypothetical protein
VRIGLRWLKGSSGCVAFDFGRVGALLRDGVDRRPSALHDAV